MSDRFDDDLRRAARSLAREPLPDHVIDYRFSQVPVQRSATRPMLTLAAGAALVLAVVIGIGQVQAPSTGDVSSSATPSSSTPASPSPASSSGPTTSPAAVLRCEDSGGLEAADDEMLVYFTCRPPPAEARAVIRSAASTTAPMDQLRTALEALLAGPTGAERDLGFSSVFGQDAEALLIGVEWQLDGLAVVDFSAELQQGALNTSHNMFLLFGALERTLFQFDAVTAVEYRLEGSCEAFATYFQGICGQTVKTAGQTSVNGCPVLAPSELPSGAPTMAARDNIQSPGQLVSWGSGADTVTQRVEANEGPFEMPPAEPVIVRGQPGFVNAIGDSPDALIQMGWNEDDCAYMVWLGPGVTLEEAIDYAGRY